MKTTMTRQGLLKALLVLALAANVSWHPLMKQLNNSDLASKAPSDSISAKSAPAAAAPAASDEDDDGKDKEKDKKDEPTQKPAKKAEVVPPSHQETQTLCGKEYIVIFEEKEISGQVRTEVLVSRPGSKELEFALVRLKPLKDIMNPRADIDKAIRAEVESKDKSCVAKVEPVQSPEKAKEERRNADERKKKEKDSKTIAQEVQDCVIDSTTHDELKDEERVSCLVDRLNHLKSDHRNDERAASDIMSKIERIVNNQLMKLLKSGLVSRDESKIENAISQVDDALSAVESLEDQYGLSDYQASRIAKVKRTLTSMKDGGEFVAKVREPQEQVRDLRNNMRDALDTLYRNPTNWMAQQRVNELRQEHLQLDAQIRNKLRSPWETLQSDLRMGYLSNEDMRVFQTPFQQLMSDMRLITDPCLSSLGSISGARCLEADPMGRSSIATMPSDIQTPIAPRDLLAIRGGAVRGQPGALGPAINFNTNVGPNMGNRGLSFPPSAMSPARSVPFGNSPMPTGLSFSPMNSRMMQPQGFGPMPMSSNGMAFKPRM